MASVAGYSGTPLVQKLGVKPAFRIKTKNAPRNYARLVAPLPEGARISRSFRDDVDLWHLFTRSRAELARQLPLCLDELRPGGMIWVSWPKKSSRVTSDVTEDTVREIALPLGLIDIKVCAVDEVWSGLKVVRRRARRETDPR